MPTLVIQQFLDEAESLLASAFQFLELSVLGTRCTAVGTGLDDVLLALKVKQALFLFRQDNLDESLHRVTHNHQALDVKCVEKVPLTFTDEALEALLAIAL